MSPTHTAVGETSEVVLMGWGAVEADKAFLGDGMGLASISEDGFPYLCHWVTQHNVLRASPTMWQVDQVAACVMGRPDAFLCDG